MFLLKLVKLVKGILQLKAFNCLNFLQLLFDFILVFLSTSTLLTDLELRITFVFFSSLLVALCFELFDSEFLFQGLNLLFKGLVHLLTTFKDTIS